MSDRLMAGYHVAIERQIVRCEVVRAVASIESCLTGCKLLKVIAQVNA